MCPPRKCAKFWRTLDFRARGPLQHTLRAGDIVLIRHLEARSLIVNEFSDCDGWKGKDCSGSVHLCVCPGGDVCEKLAHLFAHGRQSTHTHTQANPAAINAALEGESGPLRTAEIWRERTHKMAASTRVAPHRFWHTDRHTAGTCHRVNRCRHCRQRPHLRGRG